MKDKDILDLLGLTDKTIKLELTKDLEYVIENGIDDYLKKEQEHGEKKKEFIQLFRECFDELCLFMKKIVYIVYLYRIIHVLREWIYLNNMVNLKNNIY